MFKHNFHERCISEWMGRGKSTCPLCRKRMEVLSSELMFTAEELELTRQQPVNDPVQQQPPELQHFQLAPIVSPNEMLNALMRAIGFIDETGQLNLNEQQQQQQQGLPLPMPAVNVDPQHPQGNNSTGGPLLVFSPTPEQSFLRLQQMLQMIQQRRQQLEELRAEFGQEAIESDQRQQHHGIMFVGNFGGFSRKIHSNCVPQ